MHIVVRSTQGYSAQYADLVTYLGVFCLISGVFQLSKPLITESDHDSDALISQRGYACVPSQHASACLGVDVCHADLKIRSPAPMYTSFSLYITLHTSYMYMPPLTHATPARTRSLSRLAAPHGSRHVVRRTEIRDQKTHACMYVCICRKVHAHSWPENSCMHACMYVCMYVYASQKLQDSCTFMDAS